VAWTVDGAGVCPDAAPDADGLTTCEFTATPGSLAITLTVRDPEGSAGTDSITVEVAATDAPVVEITAPAEADRLYADLTITLGGVTSDTEDDVSDLRATWTSTIDGVLTADLVPTGDGLVDIFANLSEGNHGITLEVVDTDGKVGRDTLAITVGPANRAPTCGITAPADGAEYEVGVEVDFVAPVDDLDQPAEELAVTWSSDLDGTVATLNPTPAGDAGFSTSSLSAGQHVVSLVVEDERGARCTDSVPVTIGTPPNVEITLPGDGDVFDDGDLVAFAATVSDSEDAAPDLALSWASDVDGLLDTTAADCTGLAAFDVSALTVGAHVVTLTATDTVGLSASDTVSFTINGLPSAPTVEITPDPPGTEDDLVVGITVDAVDPEGGALTYTYRWTRDGVATSHTGATVPAADTTRGEVWEVTVTPNDGRADGAPGSDRVTIGNTAPEVTSASLIPTTAYTNDVLAAAVSGTDADGDSITYRYSWDVSGATVAATGGTLDGASWFDKHDTVAVTVTPTDGTDTGAAVTSSTVTILNTPPTAPGVAIDPSSPVTGDDLICEVVTPSSDDDGDTVSYTITWEVDGVAYPAGSLDTADTGFSWVGPTTTTLTDDTVPAEDAALGVEWTCTVTPNDGDDDGPSASDTVEVNDTCSGETIRVAWIDGWGSSHGNSSLAWNSIESGWATYGDCAVSIVDINQPITSSALASSGAEVILLGDIGGGVVQLSASDMSAIEAYVQGGNAGVISTYALTWSGQNNSRLADLMGVDGTKLTGSGSSVSTTLSVVDATHPLATHLPSSWTALSFTTEQGVTGGWPGALLSGASIVLGTSGQARVIAYEGGAWNGVFLTGMHEYNNTGATSKQLLYNSLIWASGRLP
jgi:hypothetical protein